jgi:photosystem II stability/assembly factor-like uncharacterized protein
MRTSAILAAIFYFSACGALEAQWEKTKISGYEGSPVLINAPGHIYEVYNDYGNHEFKRSNDDGSTWQDLYTHNFDSVTHGGSVQAVTENDRYLIAQIINGNSGDYSGIYRSTDNGDSWKRSDGKGFAISSIGKFYYFDSLLIGIEAYGGLLRSTDNGNNWNIILNQVVGEKTNDVTGLIMKNSTLYVALISALSSYPYPPQETGMMLSSSDVGNSWDTVENIISKIPVTAFVANNGIFYADAGLLYESQDMQGVWKSITYDALVPGIRFLSFSGNNIFAGLTTDTFATGTIFLSPNNGDSWYDFTDNLNGHSLYNLFVHGNYAFAGTEHDIWRRAISDFSAVPQKPDLSNPNLTLSPNPTSGTGNITYTLPKPSEVKIEIYNALGQLVQKVCDDFESEGCHSQGFDLSHVPSGEYFVRMQTGGASQVKVIHLLR